MKKSFNFYFCYFQRNLFWLFMFSCRICNLNCEYYGKKSSLSFSTHYCLWRLFFELPWMHQSQFLYFQRLLHFLSFQLLSLCLNLLWVQFMLKFQTLQSLSGARRVITKEIFANTSWSWWRYIGYWVDRHLLCSKMQKQTGKRSLKRCSWNSRKRNGPDIKWSSCGKKSLTDKMEKSLK